MCFVAVPAAAAAAGSAAAGTAAAGTAAAATAATASTAAAAGTAAATAGTAATSASTFAGLTAAQWSAVTGLASTAMGAYGSYTQSKAMQQQAEYQAAVNRNNQIIANRQAEDALKRGELEAQQYRSRVRNIQAEQLVSMAAEGADVTFGSNVDLLAETAELGELDAQRIRSNAEREAYNLRTQGMNFGAQAGLNRARASAENPLLAGGTSLLSGASTVASRWGRK